MKACVIDLGTGTVKKAYLDGIDSLAYWTGAVPESPRDEYIYWNESSIDAIRVNQWKAHFSQRDGYYGTKEKMEIVRLYNVRQDPFESFDQWPRTLGQLPQHKSWTFNTILARIGAHLQTLRDFPPAQKGSSLSIDQMIQQMMTARPSSD